MNNRENTTLKPQVHWGGEEEERRREEEEAKTLMVSPKLQNGQPK